MTSCLKHPPTWLTALLVAAPGLLLTATRRLPAAWMEPVLLVVTVAYLVVVVAAAGWSVFRQRQPLPLWALLPGAMLLWLLTYLAAMGLSSPAPSSSLLSSGMLLFALVQVIVAAAFFAAYGRGRRFPAAVWWLLGLLVVVGLAGVYAYGEQRGWGGWRTLGQPERLISGIAGTTEALMLAAAGLPAARRHGPKALLVIFGGYSYILSDSDYLYGYWLRDWPGWPFYLAAMTCLFLVVGPVGLALAGNRRQQAAAVFMPVVTFCVLRLVVPVLVLPTVRTLAGDVAISITVVLAMLLGFALYDGRADERATESLTAAPVAAAG